MTLPTEREPRPANRRPRDYVVCSADELAPGEHRIVRVRGHSIGIFNVAGRFYALHNRCPHRGAPLCEGRVCGTTVDTGDYSFAYGREGEIIRCVWHGWEFEIATGRALGDPRFAARSYEATVREGQVVVHL
jgi:nitrite reductase (NADH) small subunit